jgi:hypothetical protein
MTLPDNYTIKDLFEVGIMKRLLNVGWVSVDKYTYERYNLVYQAYRKKGQGKMEARFSASFECGCSEKTIERAVKAMNQD